VRQVLGETALLHGVPRQATVVASAPCVLLLFYLDALQFVLDASAAPWAVLRAISKYRELRGRPPTPPPAEAAADCEEEAAPPSSPGGTEAAAAPPEPPPAPMAPTAAAPAPETVLEAPSRAPPRLMSSAEVGRGGMLRGWGDSPHSPVNIAAHGPASGLVSTFLTAVDGSPEKQAVESVRGQFSRQAGPRERRASGSSRRHSSTSVPAGRERESALETRAARSPVAGAPGPETPFPPADRAPPPPHDVREARPGRWEGASAAPRHGVRARDLLASRSRSRPGSAAALLPQPAGIVAAAAGGLEGRLGAPGQALRGTRGVDGFWAGGSKWGASRCAELRARSGAVRRAAGRSASVNAGVPASGRVSVLWGYEQLLERSASSLSFALPGISGGGGGTTRSATSLGLTSAAARPRSVASPGRTSPLGRPMAPPASSDALQRADQFLRAAAADPALAASALGARAAARAEFSQAGPSYDAAEAALSRLGPFAVVPVHDCCLFQMAVRPRPPGLEGRPCCAAWLPALLPDSVLGAVERATSWSAEVLTGPVNAGVGH